MVGIRSTTTGHLRPLEFKKAEGTRTVTLPMPLCVTGPESYLPSATPGARHRAGATLSCRGRSRSRHAGYAACELPTAVDSRVIALPTESTALVTSESFSRVGGQSVCRARVTFVSAYRYFRARKGRPM